MSVKTLLSLIFFLCSVVSFGQIFSGPAQGSVASGAIVNTNNFLPSSVVTPGTPRIFNKIDYQEPPMYINGGQSLKNPADNYFEDPSITNSSTDTSAPVILRSFAGIPETNSIPPDPYVAVGPNHILATVNTSFAIWEKNGSLLKTITANSWYSSVVSNVNAFDPKVIYDHFNKRWIMVWLDQSDNPQRSHLLISVSDDSIPTGTWYNWALRGDLNGTSPTGAWSDYQGVGYDENALYVTSNQFSFGGSFQYTKVRIIPTAQMYANTAGAVTWWDIWDIRYPHQTGSRVFSIRPARMYDRNTDYAMIHAPSGGANFVTVYKISNPVTNPSLTGVNVFVTPYSSAPNAGQLGGGSPLLEGGGSSIRNEPVVRENQLWTVHGVRNPVATSYSSLHYLRIDLGSMNAVEDYTFGASGYFHFYPALAVDKYGNVGITYSRSGDNEYAGAYFTTRLSDDPPGFSGSKVIQAGKGNYVKTFGGDRNRWGDYNGMWLDPVNEENLWLFTEYAAGTNTWGTYNAEIRLIPFEGLQAYNLVPRLDFEPVEVGFNGPIMNAKVTNFGKLPLIIDSIKVSSADMKILNTLTFPYSVNTYDTLVIDLQHQPTVTGIFEDTLRFYSNNPTPIIVPLKFRGYEINPAPGRQIFASTLNGQVVKIDKSTGTGTVLGSSNYIDLISMTVNPKTKVIYGIRNSSASKTDILRFNATLGDAYKLATIEKTGFTSLAFDTSGTLYLAARAGNIYKVTLPQGTIQQIDSVKTNLTAIAFHPVTNELWGTVYKPLGTGKDKVIKIPLTNGDTVNVGATGFAIATNCIFFDENGTLYGVKGSSSTPNDLFTINTSTGVGTIVGSTGINGIGGIAYLTDAPTSVSEYTNSIKPGKIELFQNYPNPFNPSTIIAFNLPEPADVQLRVYNLLGETVAVLMKGFKAEGTHKVEWNVSGNGIPSGVYFYELKAKTSSGEFTQFRKMTYLR